MKTLHAVLLTALAVPILTAHAQDTTLFRHITTIPLPGVEGRIDHLAIDLKGQRLFVAALGNSSLEVLDLQAGRHIRSVAGLHEPQGVLFIPESKRIFVTNGQSGTVDMFNGVSLNLEKRVTPFDDADNIRYDTATNYLYVGYGNGALGILDAANGQRLADITLAGHPESFQLERSGPRVFVNVPTAEHIAVIDREKLIMVKTWPLTGAQGNFPMALDEAQHRLFVGFRKPAKLIVFDTESGKVVTSLDSAGDADDVFYDAARRRIYISCGEGFIDIFEQIGAYHYKRVAKISTAPGARTSLFVPELGRLYLAVPRQASRAAEVRVYEVQP